MIDAGDTAWVLICTGLVLFMTPGLAFFYAGMVRRGDVLAMMQQNFIALGVVTITWVLVGYSLAFGPDTGAGLLGNLDLFGLRDLTRAPPPALHVVAPEVAIPTLAFVAYQMMFAVITPALITGATADRLTFRGWVVFLAVWSVLVYCPIAHWLFNPAGWLAQRGAQDWAGGMVVHASAGAATAAMLLVVGRRRDWPNTASSPHSLPLTLIGAGILWFGWFGFNAADGLQADEVAAQALLNTAVAAAAGMLTWLMVERSADGHPTVVGGVTGAVAGLATITPAAGYVSTFSAVIIGALAGTVCHVALRAKLKLRLDDALDVLAVHFVGGALGSLLVGLFAEKAINPASVDGLLFGGGIDLLLEQALALIVVVAFSFVASWLLASAIEKTTGLRVSSACESELDRVQQGMEAYQFGAVGSAGSVARHQLAPVSPVPPVPSAAEGAQAQCLVTAILDESGDCDDLKQAVLNAGASSMMLSEAHLYTGEASSEVFRGVRKQVDFHPRVRAEVLAPRRHVARVLEVVERYASESPVFTEPVELPSARH